MVDRKHRKHTNRILDGFLKLFMIGLVLVSIFPFLYMFLLSLMDTISMRIDLNKVLNGELSLDNYKLLLTGTGKFGRYILNSLLVAIYSVTVNCFVSTMSGYAFAKKKFLGASVIWLIYLMSMMVPFQAKLIPTFLIVRNLGMINTFSGLALPIITAYGTILMCSFIKSVPDELLEAAEIDGYGEFGRFFHIVLPLIKPALSTLAIFTFVGAWSQLIWPVIIASKDMQTLSQAVAMLKNAAGITNFGSVMAGSTLAFLPPFILYILLQKQFVEGIALSGTKG